MDYQDVLAKVGAASAHPGGFETTDFWVNRVSLDSGKKVLDVGCGTGRTALEINRRFGCEVTGLDIRPAMLEKARLRAELGGQQATWQLGSAERLPFSDGQFDVVVAESVNVFVKPTRSIHEAQRVLNEQGVYINVEMFLLSPVDANWFQELRRVYGVVHLPDLGGWKRLYQNAGFSHVQVMETRPVRPQLALHQVQTYPNEDLASPQAFENPRVRTVLSENSKWLETNSRFLGYGIFLCAKRPSRTA